MTFFYNLLDTLLPFDFMGYDFMKNAFLAILLIAPMLGILGTVVVNNKMAFFADSLGHSALCGIAVGALLGLGNPKLSMIILGILFAILLISAKQRNRASTDTTISVFSSTASALGIVLLSQGGNFSKYSVYIVGDFLSITEADIKLAAVVFAIVVLFCIFLYNKTCMISVNPILAKSLNINTRLVETLFASLLALVVTISVSWVGILIITSLLTLPAASARNLTQNLKGYSLLSVALSLACGIAGLIISFFLDSATGATIVLLLSACYFLSLIFSRK